MKIVLTLFALCLVSINATPQPILNFEIMVENVVAEINQIAKDAADALKHQVEEVVLIPLNQLEDAVQSIEDLREESEECVEAVDEHVVTIVDEMHKAMNVCGIATAKDSAEIMIDINKASQQLIFDGLDVVRTYKRCQNYKNPIWKSSCYARLTIKGTLYLANARKSIKTIRVGVNERIPATVAEAETCTHGAAGGAVEELENIHASVQACIEKSA